MRATFHFALCRDPTRTCVFITQNEVLTSEERVRLVRQTLAQARRNSPAANVTFAASPSVLNCEELDPRSECDRMSPADDNPYILGINDDVNEETRKVFYYEHVRFVGFFETGFPE